MTRVGKRRLLLLLAIILVFIGALIAASFVREARRAEFARVSHEEGMAAFERGDHAEALNKLPYAVKRGYDDGETMLALAESRLRVSEENNAHISNAAELFNQAAQKMPGDPRPLRRLLSLYLQIGFLNERADAAERLLAIDASDSEALEALVETYFFMGERDEAANAAERFVDAHPADPTAHRWRLATMQATGSDEEAIASYVDQLVAEHPDDPDFAIVQAEVYGTLGRQEEARTIALATAEYPINDNETMEDLIRLLDRLTLADKADELLAQVDGTEDDTDTFDLLRVQRSYRRGKVDAARGVLTELEPADTDDDLVGWAAFLLADEEGGAEASEAIGDRSSPIARFWQQVLEARDAIDAGDPQKAREHLEQASVERPEDPLPNLFLGALDLEFGETDRAVATLESAVEGHGSWIEARNLLTEAYLQAGRIDDARRTVEVSAGLAPEAGQFLLMLRVYVQGLRSDPANSTLVGRSVELADLMLRGTNENADVHGLAATAYLLAGRQDRATELMDHMLSTSLVPRPIVLLDLANTAHSALPSESTYATRLLESAVEEDRADAQIVARLAEWRAADGRAGEGRQIIEEAIASASTDAQRLDMQLELARYLDRRKDPGARTMFASLAETHPQDQDVQLAVLQSDAAWADTALIEGSITRLRDLMGSGTTTWRIYEAQRLLGSATRENEALAVVRLLSPVVQRMPNNAKVQQLTAEAYLIAGDIDAAIRHYANAVDSGSASAGAWLRLIALQQRDGRTADARRYIDTFMGISISPEDVSIRRERARLLIAQGMLTDALSEFERVAESTELISDRLSVARLHARLGHDDEARTAFDALLASDDLDEPTVLATADFLASEGEFDRGLDLIATADPSVITPDERELQIAGYYERHGRYDNAEATLQAWAESAETSAAWEALAQFHVRRGSLEAAESAARQAVAADPDSASAEGVLALIDVIRTGNVSPEAADPLAALVQPELQEVFRALLRVEQWRQANPNDTQGLIDQLRQLAEDYPSEFRVWARLVEVASWQGPNDEAVLYANEAADALPNSIAAARLQTNMLINTERFDEARVAARRWRELTQFDPYDPEMTIAFINWRQERPGTLDLVEPWRERIVAEADESPRQLEFLATLLVEDGQVEAAHELLWPYASEEARWADIYMRTAVSIPDEAAAAEWIDRAYPVLADEISERNAVMRKVQAHYELALALNSSTQYEEVVKLVRPQLDEDDLPIEAFLRLAYAEQQLNRPDDAEVAYRRALDLNPRHPEALNNLAFLHLDAGRVTSETGTLAQRAVEAGASYRLPAEVRAELSNTHGKVLLALDRPNEANDAFQEALLLSPSHLGARLGQAEVNLRDDRPIDAERIVAEVEARREAGETFSEEIINQHESLKRQLAER